MIVYELTKPIEYEGKEITELNLDFDSLTGADMLKARANVPTTGNPADLVSQLSMIFHKEVASLAAKVPSELLDRLGARDFMAVTRKTQDFLIGQD